MYERIEPELAAERPIGSWRRSYRTRESAIVSVLVESAKLHPGVLVGSYPRFGSAGPEVDVVLKSRRPGGPTRRRGLDRGGARRGDATP